MVVKRYAERSGSPADRLEVSLDRAAPMPNFRPSTFSDSCRFEHPQSVTPSAADTRAFVMPMDSSAEASRSPRPGGPVHMRIDPTFRVGRRHTVQHPSAKTQTSDIKRNLQFKRSRPVRIRTISYILVVKPELRRLVCTYSAGDADNAKRRPSLTRICRTQS